MNACSLRRERGLNERKPKQSTKPSRILTNSDIFDINNLRMVRCECGKTLLSTDGTDYYIRCQKCKKIHHIRLELIIQRWPRVLIEFLTKFYRGSFSFKRWKEPTSTTIEDGNASAQWYSAEMGINAKSVHDMASTLKRNTFTIYYLSSITQNMQQQHGI